MRATQLLRKAGRALLQPLLPSECYLPRHRRVIIVYRRIGPGGGTTAVTIRPPPRPCGAISTCSRGIFLVSPPPGERPPSRAMAALTFDDGLSPVKQNVAPLLEGRNIPFALFVNARAMVEDHLPYLPAFPCPSARAGPPRVPRRRGGVGPGPAGCLRREPLCYPPAPGRGHRRRIAGRDRRRRAALSRTDGTPAAAAAHSWYSPPRAQATPTLTTERCKDENNRNRVSARR
jgi:hypothetical protein